MLSHLLLMNFVIAELPKEGSCDVGIESRTPGFGALFVSLDAEFSKVSIIDQ
jgi:hypothetical protein